MPGIINVDFADIRAIMENAGPALMGIGMGSGEKRASDAARAAINSPLLDISINGARGILFAVAGGDDMTMFEIQEAAKVITESIDKDAKVIFGAIKDEKLKKGEIKVTVIATGFPEDGEERPATVLLRRDEPMHPIRESRQEAPIRHEPEQPKEETKRGRIYNSLGFMHDHDSEESPKKEETPVVASTPVERAPKSEPEVVDDEDDDTEWGVPAFLRRSKLK